MTSVGEAARLLWLHKNLRLFESLDLSNPFLVAIHVLFEWPIEARAGTQERILPISSEIFHSKKESQDKEFFHPAVNIPNNLLVRLARRLEYLKTQ